MTNSPTIHVSKTQKGYFYNLIASNGQIVGTATRHFKTRKEVFEALDELKSLIGNAYFVRYHQDKNKQYRFKVARLLKSEDYHNWSDCQDGVAACDKALQTGLVSLLYSEDTNVWPLAELVQNPDKGYVAT